MSEQKIQEQLWGHPSLTQIWVILQTLDIDERGESMLGEADIEKIGAALLEANTACKVLVTALQEIRDKAKSWEGRSDEAPYWNLGDKAAAALIRYQLKLQSG